ncbi:hypothetical protein HOY82DRAFT_579740 [Tuber indicum]|nr:hypothetical protein HOY82DRAFT_579740 [Tuber indicum]
MSPMAPNTDGTVDILPPISTELPKELSLVSKTPTIAVIGGGMSGLRAAEVLLQKGYRVVVYEARDRLGGRISTSNRLGEAVDLGPNWIHGTDNNPVLSLAESSGSKLHHFSEQCPTYGFDGKLLDQAEADELSELMWKVIERAVEYSKHCHPAIPVEKSFYDYCVEKAEELFGTGAAEDEKRKKELWLSLAEMWGTFIGSPVKRQSLKYFFLEEPLEGANIFVASTYETMIDTMSKPSLDAGIVRLNTPIDEIITPAPGDRNCVMLKSSQKPEENCEVDAVIVTIPLGCLKREMINFQPKLPKRMLEGIDSLSYGTLEKARFPP